MPKRLVLLVFILLPSICFSQKKRSALFVGNSYTYSNNLPDLISQIASSKGHAFSYKQHTPGGASFSSHIQDTTWQHLFKNYSYNYLVLQGQSAELSGNTMNIGKHIAPNFYEAELLHHLSKLQDSCRQTLFFMTWGYMWNDIQAYHNMQDNVSASYTELAQTIKASVAPVGEAWRNIIQNYPNLNLHSADQSHPNIAGSYLAACVFYISIFKETAINSWHPAAISASDARILQEAAYNTINDYRTRWNFNLKEPDCVSAPSIENNNLWETYDVQTNQPFQKLQFPSNETGFAKCSFPHMLYKTEDKGARWDSLKSPNKNTLFDFHFVSDRIGFLATSDYWVDSTTLDSNSNLSHFIYPRVYKTVDGGDTWQELPLDTSLYRIKKHSFLFWTYLPNINIHFDNEQVGSIIYSNPYAKDSMFSLKTTDGGQQWKHSEFALPNVHPYPTFTSSDTAYLGSTEQSNDTLQFWQTTNGGANWERYADVKFNCCKTIYRQQYVHTVLQTKKGVMITNNLNTPWLLNAKDVNAAWDTVALIPIIGRLEAITELDDGRLVALFENPKNHRVAISNDYGKTWKLDSYHTYELNTITHTNDYMYAAGKRGRILRKKRQRKTETPPPTYITKNIYAFPNPASDNIKFQLPDDQKSFPVQLTIYDISGQQIDQILLTKKVVNYALQNLSKGLYFYQAVSIQPMQKIGQGKFVIR